MNTRELNKILVYLQGKTISESIRIFSKSSLCLPVICFESKNEPQHGMFTATCCCDRYNHSLQSCAKTVSSFWMNTLFWSHSEILRTWHATQDQSLTQFWAFQSFSALRLQSSDQRVHFKNQERYKCQCKIKLAIQRTVVTVCSTSFNVNEQSSLHAVYVPHKIHKKKLFPFQVIDFYNGDLCLLWSMNFLFGYLLHEHVHQRVKFVSGTLSI